MSMVLSELSCNVNLFVLKSSLALCRNRKCRPKIKLHVRCLTTTAMNANCVGSGVNEIEPFTVPISPRFPPSGPRAVAFDDCILSPRCFAKATVMVETSAPVSTSAGTR